MTGGGRDDGPSAGSGTVKDGRRVSGRWMMVGRGDGPSAGSGTVRNDSNGVGLRLKVGTSRPTRSRDFASAKLERDLSGARGYRGRLSPLIDGAARREMREPTRETPRTVQRMSENWRTTG